MNATQPKSLPLRRLYLAESDLDAGDPASAVAILAQCTGEFRHDYSPGVRSMLARARDEAQTGNPVVAETLVGLAISDMEAIEESKLAKSPAEGQGVDSVTLSMISDWHEDHAAKLADAVTWPDVGGLAMESARHCEFARVIRAAMEATHD